MTWWLVTRRPSLETMTPLPTPSIGKARQYWSRAIWTVAIVTTDGPTRSTTPVTASSIWVSGMGDMVLGLGRWGGKRGPLHGWKGIGGSGPIGPGGMGNLGSMVCFFTP